VGRGSNAWTVLVDRSSRSGPALAGKGLFQFQTNHFQPAPGAEILGPQIFALFEDHQGQLWAGTQNGLARWNGDGLENLHDSRRPSVVRAIAEMRKAIFGWEPEAAGLFFFKAGKFISYQKEERRIARQRYFLSLPGSMDGVLWVGTSGHGLARFYQGKWTRYSTDDGLASNSIDYIIEDDEGCLWIGSNAGLMRMQKKLLNDFAGGKRSFHFLPDVWRSRTDCRRANVRPVHNPLRAAHWMADYGSPPPKVWCR
jgi:hypothetical protein